MEHFDLYDRHMRKIDKTMPRGGTNLPGEYFAVMQIWIRRNDGKYLIQQRNKATDPIPHQWATTGGAVLAGETPLEGAIRETEEELGIRFAPAELRRIRRYFVDNDCCNHVNDVYLVERDVALEDCVLEPTEVKAVAYRSIDEIRAMIRQNDFWNYEQLLDKPGYFTLLERS